jgi:hypothetical protein
MSRILIADVINAGAEAAEIILCRSSRRGTAKILPLLWGAQAGAMIPFGTLI